jgi:hypothetical protein
VHYELEGDKVWRGKCDRKQGVSAKVKRGKIDRKINPI